MQAQLLQRQLIMHTFKSQSHQCQIDCTNHDEVINNLELKSKDLYYFWRNYEWLYNRYYSQKQEEQQPSVSTHELEEEISRLETENKKLRIDNQSLRKQNQAQSQGNSQKIEQDYQREIDRLKSNCRDYESIREKLSSEVTSLKSKIRELEDKSDEAEAKYRRQAKRQQGVIVELQQNIDELRAKMMKGGSEPTAQMHQKYRRQIHKVKVLMSSLEQQTTDIIEEQFEKARAELLNQFPRMFTQFSRGNLEQIIVEQVENQ